MTLQTLALNFFTVVMAVAAFEDFRRLTIPNLLPLLLCAAWPLYVATTANGLVDHVLGALACALAVFLGGAVLFARGWVGGGDVKLLSAVTLWAGAPHALGLLVATGLLGGVLALILLTPFGGRVVLAARRLLNPRNAVPGVAGRSEATAIPYGVAIAGAGLIVIVLPP